MEVVGVRIAWLVGGADDSYRGRFAPNPVRHILETVKHIFIILYLYTAKARVICTAKAHVICQILNTCTRLTMPNGALNSE